jgi:hypothetical protein
MEVEQANLSFEKRYEKKLSILKSYAEVSFGIINFIKCYLIAGALPALVFPFLGLATSFISMAKASDYSACVIKETLLDKNYNDNISYALRNYSCWYFAYTISNESFNLLF